MFFPALRAAHLSDPMLGVGAGFCIGLALVGIIGMMKARQRPADGR